jgi:hypothetical protein
MRGEYKYSSSYSRAGIVVNATPLPLYARDKTPVPIVEGAG